MLDVVAMSTSSPLTLISGYEHRGPLGSSESTTPAIADLAVRPQQKATVRKSLSPSEASFSQLNGQQAASRANPLSPTKRRPKDFSFLLRPEIYRPITQPSILDPFRRASKQPQAQAPIPKLMACGQFEAAAAATVQRLTAPAGAPAYVSAYPPVTPSDYQSIFSLLHTRLLCLVLLGKVDMAAQESRALEELSAPIYYDDVTGEALVPWNLRVLAVRLQAMGFNDRRKSITGYYELSREARAKVAEAAKAHDDELLEKWKARLRNLGIKVAGSLINLNDVEGAAVHLETLQHDKSSIAAMAKAMLWLQLGNTESANTCIVDQGFSEGVAKRVLTALDDMATAKYAAAYEIWSALQQEQEQDAEIVEKGLGGGLQACRMACLLRMFLVPEGREFYEKLADSKDNSHSLQFDWAAITMYELMACTSATRLTQLIGQAPQKRES